MSRFLLFVSPFSLLACQNDIMVTEKEDQASQTPTLSDDETPQTPHDGDDSDDSDDGDDGTPADEPMSWSRSSEMNDFHMPDTPEVAEPYTPLEMAAGMFEVEMESAEFSMGLDVLDVDYDHAHIPHSVELTHDWAITETEVTNAQFIHHMGYSPMEVWGHSTSPGACSDCPVAEVSWDEAQAFANALSRAHGLEECFTCTGETTDVSCEVAIEPYDCEGFRLPTEAEWEYAARGSEDFTYPGSDDIEAVAYWTENSGGQAYPVASKLPNAFGLYDMGGNIRERVYDAFYPYTADAKVDPIVHAEYAGDLRAERGGSWACRSPEIRWNRRNLVWDYERDIHTGFRVARIID